MGISEKGLRRATVGALVLVAIGIAVNAWQWRRLEVRLDAQAAALDAHLATARADGGQRTPEPGTSTGRMAIGWGGRRAPVLHVEGALPGAPLSLGEKPRPQGDWYVSRRSAAPASLNFFASAEPDTATITSHVLARLVAVDLDAPPNAEPSLAMRWEVSDDRLTYTYHLRAGVQFADGRPFTSKDVVFSFDVARDPGVTADHLRDALADVVAVEAPDPLTVVVRAARPHWRGVHAVGSDLRILNSAWYEERIPEYAGRFGVATSSVVPGQPGFADVFNRITIPCPGAGPYYFAGESLDPARPVELVQNPFFWGIQCRPEWYNVAGLRWVFIADETAAFDAFRKGAFDVSLVEADVYDGQLKDDPAIAAAFRYHEYDHAGLGYSRIAWNCRRAPFDDPRVRRAMTMLTNRQWIVDAVQHGRGRIAACPGKPVYASYSSDIAPLPFDIEGARVLLAEAGWLDTDADGVLDREGERFEFELKIGSQRKFHAQVAAQLQEACAKAGIAMKASTVDWGEFVSDVSERRFDAALEVVTFASSWLDPAAEWHSSEDVPGGGNEPGWRSPAADALLDRLTAEFDEARRIALWHEFNRVFADEQPVTLLTHSVVGVLQDARFEGATVRPTGLQVADLWVEPAKVRYR